MYLGHKGWTFWGHYISSQGVSNDRRKVKAVKNLPEPKTVTQLRGFLGLAGYYRRFIQGYGVISKPITDLLRKDGFNWTKKAEKAFDKLKLALTTAPVLALPNFSLTFVVETDACNVGIGAVLMQQGQPIVYLNKGVATQHQSLLIYDKELLALVMEVNK